VYEHPIVNLQVLKNGNLRVGALMTFVLGFGLFSSNMILPVYTQSILDWPATDAGLLMIPGTITTSLMMPVIGRLLEKGVPQKYLITLGLLLYFIFSLIMYHLLTPDTGKSYFFGAVVLRGIG